MPKKEVWYSKIEEQYDELLDDWWATNDRQEKKMLCVVCKKSTRDHVLNKYGFDIMDSGLCNVCANNNMIPM